jgi:hypothetical protein
MPVANEHPAERDVDRTRTLKSDPSVPRRCAGQSGRIEVAVLIPLLLATNIVIAVVAWYVVGAFLR